MLSAVAADESSAGTRDAAILHLLYATGLRRSSITAIRRDGVFRRDGVLIVRTVVKRGEEAEVEVPPPHDGVIERWLEASKSISPWAFPRRWDSSRPMALQTVNKIVALRAETVGARVHPHSFRVSFVTGLYDAGAHERSIQAAVHHKDPRTTQRYDRGKRGSGATAVLAKHRGLS